jgi:peptidoglycan/LPS O-acetylase OafA/YrhL
MPTETDRIRVSGHLPGLDGVRGIAILMVMALHFVGEAPALTFGQRLAVRLSSYGIFGVDLFFVLSGFLITGLLLDAKGGAHYFRNFYARRALRIFPIYFGVLAFLFVVLPRLTQLTPLLEDARRHQVWVWTYTANFYLAAKDSWAVLSYVSHFWSLAVEEHFYLLWPLVVFSLRREWLERVCLVVLAAGLGLRISLALAGVSRLSISFLTPCRIDTLCVGALLAALCRREGGAQALVRRSGPAALALGGTVLAVSAWCTSVKIGVPVFHQLQNSLCALFFGALILMSINPRPGAAGAALRSRLLRFFGKYSYGLYVYHCLLRWYLVEMHGEARFDALIGNHSLAIVAKAAFAVAVSATAAVVSYELFEKRFLALKKFFEAAAPGPAAAPVVPAAALDPTAPAAADPEAAARPRAGSRVIQ